MNDSEDLKARLFKPRLPEADVEVEGFGIVRVRGLSRAEAMKVGEVEGVLATERCMLSLGLVDPKLTEDEVGMWQAASISSELDPVSTRIGELSGMLPDSAKQAVKDFEATPDLEFPVPPGAEAGDDSSAASGGDE